MQQGILTLLLALATNGALAQEVLVNAPEGATFAVPDSKRTLLGLYVTATEAYAKWKADPEKVTIIDVRTPEEYIFVGHPEMAWNIPVKVVVYELDGEQRKVTMKSNPHFVNQVRRVISATDTVFLICRSGGRSSSAANQLTEAGFKHVFNVIDGFEGDKVDDPESVFRGKRMKNGWKNAGLPWTYDADPTKMLWPADAGEQHRPLAMSRDCEK